MFKVSIANEMSTVIPASAPENASVKSDEQMYCSECYLPSHSEPSPDRLRIFLHAFRYTTSLGTFAVQMPAWLT